jgi:hypothetical protein
MNIDRSLHLIRETARTQLIGAEWDIGIGAYLGHARLYRVGPQTNTDTDSYLVKHSMWLSSAPGFDNEMQWSAPVGWTAAVRDYYVALDFWYRCDAHVATAHQGGPSAHTAPIDHGFDLVAAHTALTADLDLTDLDLTVGTLPARILHAASTAGYDAAEIRALDLTDEDLLLALVVAAALHQPTC